MGLPLGQMVRRRHLQHRLQLPRSSCEQLAQEQGRADLGRRERSGAGLHLRRALPAGQPLRQRAQETGPAQRRPRHDLPPQNPRTDRRDVGLRSPRRHPQRRLFRLQRAGPGQPHQRRRSQAGHHRRRRVRSRQGRPSQADRRSGAQDLRHRGACRRRETPESRTGARDAQGDRLARLAQGREGRVRGGEIGLGIPAVHPVHLRHHGQAEGRRPCPRRIHGRNLCHHEICLRSEG